MARAKIVIEVDGASPAAVAGLANDVWARLDDPTRGVSLQVSVEGDISASLLNRDYKDRYDGVGGWA